MKHRAVGNSIKVYDKGGSLLRIETTINNPDAFRSYRWSEAEPEGDKQWRRMRRGVADMHRRAEVSQAANDRYAEALAALDTTTPLGQLAATVCRSVSKDGKRYRALQPFSAEDRALLEAISDGAYATGGFCNGDLASRLYGGKSGDAAVRSRIASKVSYRLRILRGHGLIRKSPGRRRYHMTSKGRQIATALLQAQHATLQQLNALPHDNFVNFLTMFQVSNIEDSYLSFSDFLFSLSVFHLCFIRGPFFFDLIHLSWFASSFSGRSTTRLSSFCWRWG